MCKFCQELIKRANMEITLLGKSNGVQFKFKDMLIMVRLGVNGMEYYNYFNGYGRWIPMVRCPKCKTTLSYQFEKKKENIMQNNETIKIKYFVDGISKLEKITQGDWIDLRVAEDYELKQGEYKLLRLGVGMILPQGYEALIVSRSSTPSRFGIISANSVGVIDNSYNGNNDEWHFPAFAIRDTKIYKNDRICQFRIIKNQPMLIFNEVDFLNENNRGGIGSTGKN